MSLRPWLLAPLLMLSAFPVLAEEAWERVQVPVVEDLSRLAAEAREARLPVLLMISRADCGYCEVLKREYLRPMILGGEYRQRALIREVHIDEGNTLTDYDGSFLDGEDMAARYKAWLTPTVLFIDEEGREVAKRLLGVMTLELYGFYLDEAIDEALAKVRGEE